MNRFLIAGTSSGCGKTTVTCAILATLCQRGLKIASFKCGPDYIDPMFHAAVIGTSAHNLDSFFCPPDILRGLLAEYSRDADVAVLEGVMGFYDGADGSAYAVSELTETPVVLVIDCKGMSDSIGAVMQGFLHYKTPNHIAGFIFNRLPPSLEGLAKHLCAELGTVYFGCFPAHEEHFDSRHLGLVTAAEIPGLQEKMQRLGALAEQYILLDELLALPSPVLTDSYRVTPVGTPRIAVAKDAAFCFHYAENLDLLQKLGCRLVFFSPIADKTVPDADGLLLPGGYPELYAAQLAENQSMRQDVHRKITAGMPVIAECGGFLYLHRNLKTADGTSYPMAGVFEADGFPVGRLQRFGYVTMTAAEDNLLCCRGEKIRAHEFHYWDSTDSGEGFTAVKKNGRAWTCCHVSDRMYAGFPHLYFYAAPEMAERFVTACVDFKKNL